MKEEARLTPQFWLDQRVEGGSMYKLERLGGSWPGWGDEGEFSLGHVELGEAGRQAGTGGVWAKACSGNRDADSGLVAVQPYKVTVTTQEEKCGVRGGGAPRSAPFKTI